MTTSGLGNFMVKNKILITGANGFLGSYCVREFAENGCDVSVIGHNCNKTQVHLEKAIDGDININNLQMLKDCKFDVIVHCGGGGSVGYSVENPYNDFARSVDSTACVLEYARKYNPGALFIYPSTPAVQGIHDNTKIKEEDPSMPVSPYGVHKKMAEELCLSYSQYFGIKTAVIRFFSIYGEGLKKQLLWDACNKIYFSQNNKAIFWGIGEETRDWIYVKDAVNFITKIVESEIKSSITINCGGGICHTIKQTLDLLNDELKMNVKIEFNGIQKTGDPKYYWADISKAQKMNWLPEVSLETGIRSYVKWFKEQV